jgi:hypothetical protein
LYRDCKADCEEAKRRLVSCVKCRESLNYEFNVQFFKSKKVGMSKSLKKKEKGGKLSNFFPIMKKRYKQKKENYN